MMALVQELLAVTAAAGIAIPTMTSVAAVASDTVLADSQAAAPCR